MVPYNVILEKELNDVKHLKLLTLLYDFISNSWIPFIIHYYTLTYERPNVTYVLVVWIFKKVDMFQLQCPQLILSVI
jgi:hypothetical protein